MKRVVLLQWLAVLAIGVGIGYAAGLGQWISAMNTTGEQGLNATGTNTAAPCCSQHGEAEDSASTTVSLPGVEGTALPSCCSQGVSRTKMMAATVEKPATNSATETASTSQQPTP